MEPCASCGHTEPHDGGGLGICRHPGCGCDGQPGEDGTPTAWIIALEGSPDPQHFGPFVDEDEALAWGFGHLADFEPEEWEPYALSLTLPHSGGSDV